jgi:hypothetical protein
VPTVGAFARNFRNQAIARTQSYAVSRPTTTTPSRALDMGIDIPDLNSAAPR